MELEHTKILITNIQARPGHAELDCTREAIELAEEMRRVIRLHMNGKVYEVRPTTVTLITEED